jgi:hypothetical protein
MNLDRERLLYAIDRNDPRPLLVGLGLFSLRQFRSERYIREISADALARARREGV